MINYKFIVMKGLFDYFESEDPEGGHHNAISLMTGKHLMEVYYWKFPVFRCNMGLCIDDDVFVLQDKIQKQCRHSDSIIQGCCKTFRKLASKRGFCW